MSDLSVSSPVPLEWLSNSYLPNYPVCPDTHVQILGRKPRDLQQPQVVYPDKDCGRTSWMQLGFTWLVNPVDRHHGEVVRFWNPG